MEPTLGTFLFLGALAWLAGAAQFALTFQQLRRANAQDKIPQVYGRPRNHPAVIYVYRAIALFLLMVAHLAWSNVLGYWALLLMLIGVVPAIILNARHNRHVRSSPVTASG